MTDRLDEKQRLQAVLKLKKYEKHANEDALIECAEQMLLSTNSGFFEWKKNICNFALTVFGKVKELRKCLDSSK